MQDVREGVGAWLVRMSHTESQECDLGPGSKGTKDLPSGRSLRRYALCSLNSEDDFGSDKFHIEKKKVF